MSRISPRCSPPPSAFLPCIRPLVAYSLLFISAELRAEDAAQPKPAAKPASPSERLAWQQGQVATKFSEFENLLLNMSRLTAAEDPKRAALLARAVAQSKERLIGLQMQQLVKALEQQKLSKAVDDEQAVEGDLHKLLELLLSEQRSDRVKEERERLKAQIRRIKELINKQVQLHAETSGQGQSKELAQRQDKIAAETGELARDMKSKDASGQDAADKPKLAQPKPGEKPSGSSGEPDRSQQPAAPKRPSESKPGEKASPAGKPGKADKPEDKESNKGAAGKPGEKSSPQKKAGPAQRSQTPPQPGGSPDEQAESADASPPPADTPGRKRIVDAQEKMDEARKKLEQAKREGAAKDQEEAVRALEQARAELEEILRQLREEEVERTLAQLEARFRRMLEMQQEVYEGTQRINRIAAASRTRGDDLEITRLSRRESQIVVEADKALAVLHDEGTAVALPEAVEQMRDDMNQVVLRLGQLKVDAQTLGIEEDILSALEEIIAALKQAQRDRESAKQPPSGPQGQPQDPPLVDRLAELRMIRSLQMRVNQRTKRYQRLVEGAVGQTDTPELLDALQQLAQREQRIYRTTRDIVLGKNQ